MNRDLTLFVSRIAMSAVFLFSGFDKLINWQAAVTEATSLGLPSSAVIFTIIVQLVGAIAVLSGIFFRWGILALLLFTLIATLIAHWPLGLPENAWRMALTISLEHLAIIGGFLLLLVIGPGKIAFGRPS
ncbi:DoxX family protein [Shewanella dokdonensis]|uniref:DoxX family protein n=1 Tax=Shewanella dokdonensis TaxID=712036 RepID=A0ABX8DIG3_9GAMM|nr:DoxX family protein [Shewanella dokdonensis]MCL1075548.1 DoxX family protein [Shewanella dokdonensis]QVK24569.1 DoxX family protein [Shewanella dokdonensis]